MLPGAQGKLHLEAATVFTACPAAQKLHYPEVHGHCTLAQLSGGTCVYMSVVGKRPGVNL